jgi:thioredoxin-related protein
MASALGTEASGKDSPIFQQYAVQAYPTNYVLDSTGKIVFRSVGFDEPGIRAALKKLGVK